MDFSLPWLGIWQALTQSPLVLLALMFLLASVIAELAVRYLRIPRFSALVLSGLGLAALAHALNALPPSLKLGQWLEAFSMLILFEIGQRLSYEWLKRNPWLVVISLFESVVTFVALYLLLVMVLSMAHLPAIIVAVIGMASSPIAVLAVSKELRARGQVTERTLLFSTLSTVYAALALQLTLTGALVTDGLDIATVMQPIVQLCGSFLMGTFAAWLLLIFARIVTSRGAVQVVAVASMCALIYAVCQPFGLSPLLAAIAFGLMARAIDTKRRIAAFELTETGTLLTIAFFVLTGAALQWQFSWEAYAIAIALVGVRLLTKMLANSVLALPSGLMIRKGILVGLAQAPLSGVALMLTLQVVVNYPHLAQSLQPALAAILLLAVAGPALTEVALRLAKEHTPEIRSKR